MNLLLRGRLIVSLVLLLVLIFPVYSYKKIKVFVIDPPEQILPGVKQIAVLDFEGEGNYGRNFSDYLIGAFLEENRGIYDLQSGFLGMGEKKEGKTLQEGTFTNVFGIIERSRLLQVLDEQQLGAGGLLNQSQAAQLGQILGVQALVLGNVSYTYKDNDFQEERTYTKDKKQYTTYVNCRKRGVTATVRARIIGAESGQILGSKEATRALEKKECESNIANLPPVAQMVDDCLKQLSSEIANYLAPHYSLSEYELEKIELKQFKDLGETAAKKAESLEIDGAYVLYKSIYDQDPYNPELLYNMGILNEVVGNYGQAKEFYEMALQLKEEKNYKKAFTRVEKNLMFSEALRELGIVIAEHSFEISETIQAAAMAQKIEIKGGSADRIPVFAEPREGSEVVGQVPGGISFNVLNQEGQYYRIKLLGGKEGYVHQSKAKMK